MKTQQPATIIGFLWRKESSQQFYLFPYKVYTDTMTENTLVESFTIIHRAVESEAVSLHENDL